MEKQGKKISELRVVDLRLILEKRGLEKSGNKSVLIERFSKVGKLLTFIIFLFVCMQQKEKKNEKKYGEKNNRYL